MKALRTMALSSRPVSWVNTAIPFALAYYVVAEEFTSALIVGSAFFLIPYNFLMYGINDVFDYESDLRNPRKGGVEGALLPPHLHRATLVASVAIAVPFIVVLVAWGSLRSSGVLALSLLFVVAYSAKGMRFKEIPFVDSLTSSAHFVLPAVYGVLLAGGSLTPLTATLLGAFFLWGMASHAFGAVQDVLADREAGVGSIATVIGARGTVRFALVLYALAGVVMLTTPWPLPVVAPVALLYMFAVVPWWQVSDENAESANRGWKWFLSLNFIAGAVVVLVLFEWWDVVG
ncbi:MAG: 4-hydroxybenzoate polyprenyltransferase [Pontimonas sp.]|jgi:4-hydroxybenzoate polyprenyltransferase